MLTLYYNIVNCSNGSFSCLTNFFGGFTLIAATYEYTKKSVYTRLVEPLCHTTSALNHGCNFGTRLYNKIIEKHTALEQYNCIKFKKEIKKIIYHEYIHSDAQIFIS